MMILKKSLLGALVALTAVGVSRGEELVDESSGHDPGCRVELAFSYFRGGAEMVRDTARFDVAPQTISPAMAASLVVLNAGRTIQTLVRDWHGELETPSIFNGVENSSVTSSGPIAIGGITVLPPVNVTKKPKESGSRGKRFAKAIRDFKTTLENSVTALSLSAGSPLKRQFYDLTKDLDSLAQAFEEERGPRYGGVLYRGGPALSFSAASLEMASDSGSALESGGVMTDKPFWEEVRQGMVPELADFNLDGFIKRFRLAGGTQIPTELAGNYVIPLGDAAYDPTQGKLFLKIDMVSPISEEMFQRPPLDFVVALDISGSMGMTDTRAGRTRLDGAKAALIDMIKTLQDEDRISVIVFDDKTEVLIEPTLLKGVDRQTALIEEIQKLQTRGATDLGRAQKKGYALLSDMAGDEIEGRADVQRRLILITDAMTNQGEVDYDDLANLATTKAGQVGEPIYTTVIGVGTGFNQELSEKLAGAAGGMFYFAANGDDLYKLFEHFDTRMFAYATHFQAALKLIGFPGSSRVAAVHGSGVEDAKGGIKIGKPVGTRPVLVAPTLKFADRQMLDPNAGGGAFLIEIDLVP